MQIIALYPEHTGFKKAREENVKFKRILNTIYIYIYTHTHTHTHTHIYLFIHMAFKVDI